jgi:hypothetical protein
MNTVATCPPAPVLFSSLFYQSHELSGCDITMETGCGEMLQRADSCLGIKKRWKPEKQGGFGVLGSQEASAGCKPSPRCSLKSQN